MAVSGDALSDAVSGLAAALACRSEQEPAHERELREAMRTAAFAGEVLEAWDQQELHRGHRMRYGLTKEHAAYARSVRVWAWYRASVAKWMADALNREALRRLAEIGYEALSESERSRIGARPSEPTGVASPTAHHAPPHWPAEPWAVGASELFFAALRDKKKTPPGARGGG